MSNLSEKIVSLDEAAKRLRGANVLQPGGGGGTYDGMDPWQQTVETRLGELRGDTRGLVVDMAALKERVAALPTKGFIVTATMTAIAALTAAIVFADKLRALVAG